MIDSMLFIHAPNVHNGGGKELLLALISKLPNDLKVTINIDSRMELPNKIEQHIIVNKVSPNLKSRLQVEFWLAKHVKSQDLIFCFGNLPPLFKVRSNVIVYIQNKYLIDNSQLNEFSITVRARLTIERFWLYLRIKIVSEFWIQTPSMKSLLLKNFIIKKPIKIVPFVCNSDGYSRVSRDNEESIHFDYDFIYIASGEPHKNHRKLIEAWCVLAEQNIFPSLCLTISDSHTPDLITWINLKIESYKLNISNLGIISKDKLNALYKNSKALIYPSYLESFGLPLIEARQAGLSILAAELDYVRDILDPDEVFEPHSAVSIARAVKRFLKLEESALPLLSANEIIERLSNRIN